MTTSLGWSAAQSDRKNINWFSFSYLIILNFAPKFCVRSSTEISTEMELHSLYFPSLFTLECLCHCVVSFHKNCTFFLTLCATIPKLQIYYRLHHLHVLPSLSSSLSCILKFMFYHFFGTDFDVYLDLFLWNCHRTFVRALNQL